MATKGIHQLLIALIAQLAPDLAPVWISRPAAVETDDRDNREIVPHRGVHLHGVHTERAIAVEYQYGFVRPRSFRTHTKGYADSHGAKGTRIEAMPWHIRRDGLTTIIQDFLPVDDEDAVPR